MSVVVTWNEVYVMLTGLVVFLVCAKLLELMKFSKFTKIFVDVLRQSSATLAAFSLMFFIVFLAFSISGNLLFGKYLKKFSSLLKCLQECAGMLIGKSSFRGMMLYQPVLGGFYFVWFMSLCYMILMNVFMTILNESITESGKKEERVHIDYIRYLMTLLKECFGFGGGRSKRGAISWSKKKQDHPVKLQIAVGRLIWYIEQRYGRVEYERIAAKESYLRTVNTLELSEKRNFRSRKLSFLTELNLELEKHFPEKKCCMGSTEMRNINNG